MASAAPAYQMTSDFQKLKPQRSRRALRFSELSFSVPSVISVAEILPAWTGLRAGEFGELWEIVLERSVELAVHRVGFVVGRFCF